MILKENIREIVYWAFRTVNPWKKRDEDFGSEFAEGWNSCLKEIKKRQKKYIKNLSKIKSL